jgi:hypothetical protein
MAKRKTKLNAPLQVRLAADMREGLNELASADGRPLGNYIRRVLLQHLIAKSPLPSGRRWVEDSYGPPMLMEKGPGKPRRIPKSHRLAPPRQSSRKRKRK